MSSGQATPDAGRRVPCVRRPVLGRRDHYVTLGLTLWTVLGLYIDAWAHGQSVPESFFSPYHAVFYTGFVATAAWMLRPVLRLPRRGTAWHEQVPCGYDLGLIGIAVFAAGGLGDLAWHARFGIERGIEALMSPPHLGLFVGLILIASSPFRAAWAVGGRAHRCAGSCPSCCRWD
jgi:hypothetical protein